MSTITCPRPSICPVRLTDGTVCPGTLDIESECTEVTSSELVPAIAHRREGCAIEVVVSYVMPEPRGQA